jgi:hypothetical protein
LIYTLDTEFDGHNGPLISLALVPDKGDPFYFVTYHKPADPWVEENVMPIIGSLPDYVWMYQVTASEKQLGFYLKEYFASDKSPTIIADSHVDIGRFARAINTASDGSYCSSDLEDVTYMVHNVDCWPNNLPDEAVQHNAYWDAVALWDKLNQ